MADRQYFSPKLFGFLKELKANNDREWFNANKDRYEDWVRQPAMEFIADFAPRLAKISRHFTADPKRSMFRIYRDIRFSKDKRPYKTHVGIQFRHQAGKDAHAPGFYLHLEPDEAFVGVGIWAPDGPTATRIRDAIVADPAAWKRASRGKKFGQTYTLMEESLKRPPRGYDPNHAYVADLMRKNYCAIAPLNQKIATGPGFMRQFTQTCKAGTPLVRFLCNAVGVGY